ncbi:hypothetical protein OG206_08385 [Streptomyces sp. NBC_01341]|uniref:hypothetical protein n=1 Tax=Streptomyces sp. NBC_01341 TaxID=2903831 RepID=UPI002E1174EA|nr:hypothetical protein OG206_08385 [Streptomyces sp. NBC_01341]
MVRRWVPVLALGGMWWWAVLRLLLEPEHAGLVEGAVVAGGWGLSLLPVHVTATARPARAPGELRTSRPYQAFDEPRTCISAPPPTADRPGGADGEPF